MTEISPAAKEKADKAILITGSARSGTTIIGKIIHSLSDVEYAFEPPILFSLFSLIYEMPEYRWTLLYQTYLYESHLLNALAGRSINCNRHDDSSIYMVKSEEDIEDRLNKSRGKQEIEALATASTVAYKIPDILPRIPKLLEYYPQTRVVIVNRGYIEILNSLSKKEWFSNENANKNLIWPFTIYKDINIPFWVVKDDHETWYNMSALDRCAYYYLEIVKNIDRIPNRIDVRYEALLENPVAATEKLAKQLGLSFGSKTRDILATIKLRPQERDTNILDKVDETLRMQIIALSGKSKNIYA
ncbi:MAG: hypothetical protein CO093_04390 [Alphaproteobacteria bacterium CG_4_9_14_3_um_filter_47_13]|nr:MAG: hypothetical protein CO093_04390 [Alphaproteobacteria bacterium CG_4_9_14_3_um_filter_47_13]